MSTYVVDNIDSQCSIQDQTDETKKLQFNLSNLSTSTTRTATVPNNNFTLVGRDIAQTLTNKTIDVNNNTVTNIANANIKNGAAIDASKIANGSVSNTKFQYLSDLASSAVGESDTQTLTNKTLTDASTYIQDNVDNTKKIQFQVSGVSSGTTRTLTAPNASTTLVGTNVIQTLTNKTIDADSNSISNIDNADIKAGAGIDASKIADGSVSDTEFQYISTVTSNVQDQIDNHTGDTDNPHSVTKSQVGLSEVPNLKVKLDATTAPTTTNDSNSGYAVGSVWINTTANKAYICVDATASAAIWTEATQNIVETGWQRDGSTVSLINTSDKVGIGISDPTKFFEVRKVDPGTSDHVQLVVSDSAIADTYNLGLDTGDSCMITMSCEDFTYRQAAVFCSDGGGTSTIFGVSGSSNSGSSWEPKFVIKHNARVGIGKNNPAEALDVVGNIALTGTVDGRDVAADGSNQDSHIAASSGAHGVTGSIVGTTDTQTLTNKTIDADQNSVSNIDNADIKESAAIDATKIADGTVTNTEFQYINSVTSNVQTQLNTKLENGTNIGMGIEVFKQKSGTDLEFKKIKGTETISVASTPVENCYDFEDDVQDSLGMQDGTIAGGVTYTTGKVGSKCADFDGVSGTKVNIGTLDVPNTTEFSISCWFKVDTFTDARLVSKASSTNVSDHIFALCVPSSSGVAFRLTAGSLGSGTELLGSTSLSTDTWYHFIAWYDGANYKIYLNGSQDATASKTGTVPTSNSINTSIGNQPPGGGGDRAFNGQIDQVIFWNKALTSQEISDLYNSGSGRDYSYFESDQIYFDVNQSALDLDSVGGTLSVEKGGTGKTSLSSGKFLEGNGTSAVITTKAVPTGDVVGTTDSQTMYNKNLDENTTFITCSDTPSSKLTFSCKATTNTTTTVEFTSTTDRTISLPDATTNLVGHNTSQTLSNKKLTLPQINDTSANHQYKVAVNELTADRIVTLPLLTGNDEFTFNAHTQTLTNKTIDTASNTITVAASDVSSGTFANARIAQSNVTQHEGSINIQSLTNAPTGNVVGTTDTQTLTNKTLTDSTTYIQDNTDTTKKVQFEVSGVTTSTTRTLTVPDANTTIVGTDATQTLTNKTIDTASNTITVAASDVGSGTFADARVAESNVTQHEGAINHDNLTGYVAAEHLDWTTNQDANNIHDNNISQSSVTQHQNAIDHGSLSGIADDDHTQYTHNSGRSGGQTVIGGTGASEDITIKSTSHATKGKIKLDNPVICNDSGFNTSYPLSVQSNASYTYFEILNSAGAGKGSFFGQEGNEFAQYNWQGGNIIFYTDTTASSGQIRFTIQNDGDVRVHNLGNGVVKSSSSGVLSHESTNTGFNKSFGTSAGTVVEGDHVNTATGIHGVTGNIVGTSDVQTLTNKKFGDNLNMNSNKITNLTTPTADSDAANKSYVDGIAQGLDAKDSVRVKTNAALPTYTQAGSGVGATLTANSNGALPTIDGITLTTNDRILVDTNGSATDADNGIYVVTQVGDVSNPWILTRATDADNEISAGMFCFVTEGTNYADSGFILTTNDPITVDTTSLNFTQFSGAGQITAGTGLTKTGQTLDVGGSATIIANADTLEVNSSNTDNQVLLSNGAAGEAASYGALPLNDSNAVTGSLPVSNGGTGTASLTSGKFLQGNGTSAVITTKAVPTGVVVGTTDAQTLTNKTINTASNTITIATADVTSGTFADARIAESNVTQHESAINIQNLTNAPTGSVVGTTDSQTLTNKSFKDSTTYIVDHNDTTKKVRLEVSGVTTGNTRTLTVPNANTTIVGTDATQTLTNKTIDTASNTLTVAASDVSSGTFANARIAASNVTQHENSININNLADAPTGTVVGESDTQTLTNKSLSDSTTYIIDNADNTKKVQFQVSGVTTGNTRTLSVPNANTTIVGTDATQTLTNKTINTTSNTITVAASDVSSGTFADARIAESNVTQHESAINHDNLEGFVAAEHYNWTADQGANNIHQNNITQTSVTQHEGAINIQNLTGAPTGTVVGLTDTQTLTGKTISANSNTITISTSEVTTGTFADARIAESNVTQHESAINIQNLTNAPAGSVVGTSDVQTLTNKKFGDNLNMNNNKITNLTTPTADSDAANKSYVDGVAQGIDAKDAVRAKTAAALPAYTQAGSGVGATLTADANGALPAVDGVTLVADDRVLVDSDGSATDADNGIYVVTQVGDVSNPWILTRSTDADNEISAGMFCFITEGTTCADAGFVLTTNNPITVDTTALNFTQFSGAGQITAGDGLTKTGQTLDVGGSSTIIANDNTVEVNSSGTANQVLLSSGTVGTASTFGALPLNNANAVTGQLPVNRGGTGAATLTSGKFLQGNGTSAVISTKSVPTGDVIGTTDTQTLTNKTIDADNNTITNIDNADIKAGAGIDATKLADGSVTNTELQYLNSITSNVQTQLDDKIPYAEDNLICVKNGNPGNSNHIQFCLTKNTLADNYNLGIDTGDPCKCIWSCEDGSQRQATVLASDGSLTATIFGVACSNNSGSSWQPVIVARQDQRVGIAKNNPTEALDVTGNIAVSGTVDGRDIATDGSNQDSHIAASSGVHGITGSVVGTTDVQTLTNKTLDDASTYFADNADNTKKVQLQLGSLTTATTRTLTVPDANTTIVGHDATQTLSNKTIDTANNTLVIAAGDVSSGTFANARISASNVTQHENSININNLAHAPKGTVVGTTDSQTLTNKSFKDSSTYIVDNTDNTKKVQFEVSGVTTATTRTLTVPDENTTIAGTDAEQTLTNKVINTASNTLTVAAGDVTSGTFADARIAESNVTQHEEAINIQNLTGAPTGTVVGISDTQTLTNKTINTASNTITVAASDVSSGTFADARIAASNVTQHEGSVNIQNLSGAPSGTVVGTSDTQTLTNKTFKDSSTYIVDNTDSSKKVQFQVSGVSTSTTRTLTVPNANTTIVGTDAAQTLTNKTINTANNTISVVASDVTSGTFANARISESSVTQHEGAINHDNLSGYVTAEHLDWTADQGEAGNIHQNNISQASVTQHESAITIGNLSGAPSGSVVGTSDVQTLTNKKFGDNLNMNNNKITNLTTPTADSDAANKSYVDGVAQGIDAKDSVRAKTVAALPAYTQAGSGVGATLTANANGALPTIDGVTLVADDRILVDTNGSAADADNGIYAVTQVGDGSNPWILTRATDADANAEVTAGLFVFVTEGTSCADSGFILTTNDPITVDTTALNFTQFSGAGQITAGDGLTKTGQTIDVVGSDTIIANDNTVEVNSSSTANQVLLSSGTVGTSASYGALPLNNANAVTGQLPVNRGGTGAATLTSGKFLQGNGTSAVITTKAVPSGAVVGTTDAQTLTNKTINTASNTITVAASDVSSGTFANARIAQSNVTQHEGAINHDNLSGYVAAEHYDWTADQDANNIHHNNITQTAVTQHEGSVNISNLSGAPTGTVVGTTDTQTLTNKTINTASNTLSIAATDITSGTLPVARGGTGQVSHTADAILVGNGTGGIRSSGWSVDTNGVMDSNFSHAGYILDVHNTKVDGGGNGFRIMAGELEGDIAFHVADADDSFQIMELEADDGHLTLGKTYAQTVTDNGLAYGIDIQHTGVSKDFNTQVGTYRIAGVDVVMPTGGSTGQALVKNSGTNYDTAWSTITKTIRQGHTWAISGEIKVASGDTDFIMPMFVSFATGQTAKLASARYVINSGTSVTAKLQKNGVDITGFTGISVTTTPATTNPSDVTLAENDKIALVVTAVAGTPKNLSFTIFMDHTV